MFRSWRTVQISVQHMQCQEAEGVLYHNPDQQAVAEENVYRVSTRAESNIEGRCWSRSRRTSFCLTTLGVTSFHELNVVGCAAAEWWSISFIPFLEARGWCKHICFLFCFVKSGGCLCLLLVSVKKFMHILQCNLDPLHAFLTMWRSHALCTDFMGYPYVSLEYMIMSTRW